MIAIKPWIDVNSSDSSDANGVKKEGIWKTSTIDYINA